MERPWAVGLVLNCKTEHAAKVYYGAMSAFLEWLHRHPQITQAAGEEPMIQGPAYKQLT